MNFVEQIRDRKKFTLIKNFLRGQRRYRDLLLFVIVINSVLLKADQPRNMLVRERATQARLTPLLTSRADVVVSRLSTRSPYPFRMLSTRSGRARCYAPVYVDVYIISFKLFPAMFRRWTTFLTIAISLTVSSSRKILIRFVLFRHQAWVIARRSEILQRKRKIVFHYLLPSSGLP